MNPEIILTGFNILLTLMLVGITLTMQSDLHVATVRVELQERERYLVRDESLSQIEPPLSSLPIDHYATCYSSSSGKYKQEAIIGDTKAHRSIQQVPLVLQ